MGNIRTKNSILMDQSPRDLVIDEEIVSSNEQYNKEINEALI